MDKKDGQQSFNETQHALLFAWIAKSIVERTGEQRGESVIRKAVRQYGEERGRRMALRAQANKHPASMANYFGYSEYRISPGVMEMKFIERTPHIKLQAFKCPWHTAWKENGLLASGYLYCQEVDQALVHGYNPELELDVISTLSRGDAQCEFVYHDANLTIPKYVLLGYRRAFNPGMKAVMPWDYQVGHLFATLEKVAVNDLGQDGQKAIEAGLAKFIERYGEQAGQKVVAGRNMDYESIPGR